MSKKEKIKFFIYIGLVIVLVPLAVWKIPVEAEKTPVTFPKTEKATKKFFNLKKTVQSQKKYPKEAQL